MSHGMHDTRRRASMAVISSNGSPSHSLGLNTDLVNGRRGSMRITTSHYGQDGGDHHLQNASHANLHRRRSLPKTPKKKLSPQLSEEVTPGLTWDSKQQAYLPNNRSIQQEEEQRFQDQFDQYLYQSRHITTPVINVPSPPQAPELFLEVPSDSDSSRRPSRVSICPSSQGSTYSPSPRVSQAKLELENLVIPGNFVPQRRASHSGELPTLTPSSQRGDNATKNQNSLLSVPRGRTRGSSLPENLGSNDLYRLRNFSISGRRVINRGDSFRSRSANSVGSSIDHGESHHSGVTTESHSTRSRESIRSGSRLSSLCNSRRSSRVANSRHSQPNIHSQPSPVHEPAIHRVLMLGSTGVGKSSLCAQFLSSDHINTYDRAAVEADDMIEKEVCVAVNDKESRIVFIDHQHGEMSLENMMVTYSPSAYLVVFAVDEKASLDHAERVLAYLSMSNVLEEKTVILVANKTDLVRKRLVKSAAGKNIATKFNIKYIETSPGINHNVDELLVGVLTQITLREKGSSKKKNQNKVLDFFSRVLNITSDQAKSCSNLNIL